MKYTTIIAADELSSHLTDPDFAIVDCRFKLEDPEAGRRAYLAAHIPGAVYAHLDADLSGSKTGRNGRHPLPTPEALIKTFGAWGISETTQVITYDDMSGGLAAARLWWMLRYLGHDAAAVLDGGWQAWLAAGYPTRSGSESRIGVNFVGHPRPEMLVDADSVSSLANSLDWMLIDSRAAARYRGDEETLDPVAGHIPGARSHFWQNNLDASGHLLPPDQLRERFRKILGPASPEHSIFYCGSGVTAGQNLLAMEVAGLTGAKLYAGSWSEWCSDPSRPVAKNDE